jgi:hypothetical protein
MVEDIHKLLDSDERYYIIFKSRNAEKLRLLHEVAKSAKLLISHSRCRYLNNIAPEYKAYQAAGICDIVIGDFFSSASLETVAGGVPTILYAQSERIRQKDFYVKNVSRFCAFNYKEIKEYINYWLSEASGQDFSKFQNDHIKKTIDSYCDGRATLRLHGILELMGTGCMKDIIGDNAGMQETLREHELLASKA